VWPSADHPTGPFRPTAEAAQLVDQEALDLGHQTPGEDSGRHHHATARAGRLEPVGVAARRLVEGGGDGHRWGVVRDLAVDRPTIIGVAHAGATT